MSAIIVRLQVVRLRRCIQLKGRAHVVHRLPRVVHRIGHPHFHDRRHRGRRPAALPLTARQLARLTSRVSPCPTGAAKAHSGRQSGRCAPFDARPRDAPRFSGPTCSRKTPESLQTTAPLCAASAAAARRGANRLLVTCSRGGLWSALFCLRGKQGILSQIQYCPFSSFRITARALGMPLVARRSELALH